MLRDWPGESQHVRRVFGLECLRAIGTDVALMQLSGIAQKLPFKGLKAKATEFMEVIARDRGLSRAELEDRIIPDCELDDRGGRVFDFGPRQFRFALGNAMKPMVRDEAGKLKDDLPKPGAQGRRGQGRCRDQGLEATEKASPRGGQGPGRTARAGDGRQPSLEPGRLRVPLGPASAHDPPRATGPLGWLR